MALQKRTAGLAMAAGLAIASAVLPASALTLDDFLPPVEGGTSQPQAAVSQKGDVVQADNMQDGLGYAYQRIMAEGQQGILTVQTKTGMGVIATSTVGYQTYQNLNATLLGKRSAYVKAFTDAQAQMVKYMEGLTNNCETAVSSRTLALDSGMESAANSTASVGEACGEMAQGVLAGFITYSVNDNVETKEISVSLASSTRTRAAVGRVGGAVVVSGDPQKAFQHIAKEISLGIVPPLGAKLITNPENGESIVIGFGSAIIRENRDQATARKLQSMANRQATMRANNALIAFLNGSNVYWQGGFDEKQLESSEQFNIPVDGNGQVMNPVVYDQTKHDFLNVVAQTDDYRVVTGGKLPPGVHTKTFPSEDGHWMNTIAVYMPSATAAAMQASRENRAASGKLDNPAASGRAAAQGRTMQLGGGLVQDGANPAGPSGKLVRDNDF